jgi:curved DNA-binding protein CbpA
MDPAKNYYESLGVPADADAPAIQAAFRALAKKFHPDGSASTRSAERFIEIQEAYEVLGASEARQAYDAARLEWEQENRQAEEEARWHSLLQRNPTVAKRHAELACLAKSLAQRYRAGLLNGDLDADDLARHLEEEFLRRHFGVDPRMQNLGKALLREGRRSAAAKLAAEIKALPQGRLTAAQRRHFAERHPALGEEQHVEQGAWTTIAPLAGLFILAGLIAIGAVDFVRSGPTDVHMPLNARPSFGGPPVAKPDGNAAPQDPQETKTVEPSRKRVLDRLPESETPTADANTTLARDDKVPEEEIKVVRPTKKWLYDRIAPSGGEASN